MSKEMSELQKQSTQAAMETERTRNRKVYVPKVDIYETKEAIILIADMPGVDEQSVDVVLDKNVLTISGRAEPLSFKDYSIAYSEYDVGDYQRAFTISDEVDREKIEATVKNGVLRLTLHKAEQVKAKKIVIKAA
ncbi:MAG TPA: Hsp20/alpha crystallin family protein [Syntrophales bacterium]|jgi:HSP20 family molecular chaperone IbpA|nr:Hsp20/alpha crystallin family protein [Syntrophales bacterium]HPX56514.1 Hsp20/alpha crystallin family protein [Syntrophales bacterium]HQA82726.1 Hsp20/alpha crystallin family protein [Syntrophales bacterium]